ncbi:MAG: YceI family protein [Chitinophagaceae bacterium]|nr:MAG: YceI family protein [Chitinophagaceae bacterium]
MQKKDTMKNNRSGSYAFIIACCALFLTMLLPADAMSQKNSPSSGKVSIVIEGTSNVHDWDIKSDKGICTSVFDLSKAGLLNGISELSFTIPAESLKSDHKGMDKNTYKALNTGKYASILFKAGSIEVKPSGKSKYALTTKGKLTIAGVSNDVVLTATGTVNADQTVSYSGSYQLKMTDYKVDPPKAVLGTIKTGDKVVVKYDLVLKSI